MPKHDPFFSSSMEYTPIAQAFFLQHLPKSIKKHILPNSFRRIDRIHTDQRLKQRRRDVAYLALTKDGHPIHLYAEHQSGKDRMMLARFLQYNTNDIAAFLKKQEKVPVGYNFMFYHGKESPYSYTSSLKESYVCPNWGSRELDIRIRIVDGTQLSDRELLSHSHCAPAEILLKHGRDGNFELEIGAYRKVFRACIAAVGEEYIIVMLNYATSLANPSVGEKVFYFIEQVLSDQKELIMTYGQKLQDLGKQQGILQGVQQGVQQGMEEGIWKVAKNMLYNLHLGVDVIQGATGLSREAIHRL